MANKKTYDSNDLSELVNAPLVMLDKNTLKAKETYSSDELCALARAYAMTAIDMHSKNNKCEDGKKRAMAALNLYYKLNLNDYEFQPSELVFIKSVADIIDPELHKKLF